MSAIGAVPGYAYPALAYAETEFFQNVSVPVTNVAATNIAEIIATANTGGAIYPRNVFCTFAPSAAVATRIGAANVLDGDNRTVSTWQNPLVATAGVTVNWIWDISLATSSTVAQNGYSPFTNIVLPPGWKLQLVVFPGQIGDALSAVQVTGIRIPTATTEAPAMPLIQKPLLT